VRLFERMARAERGALSNNASVRIMRCGVGRAVMELRRRKEWDQTQLASELHRYHRGSDVLPSPHRITITRWECGANLPSLSYRLALARLAAAHGDSALEEAFTAPQGSWRLVGALIEIGILGGIEQESLT
jgi:transcriptional regulator with XRE-family HTH domain